MLSKNSATSIGLLVLRVAIGAMMMVHGLQKLSAFGDLKSAFPDRSEWAAS